MNVLFAGNTLADPSAGVWHYDLIVNGQCVVDAVDGLRSPTAFIFARGNKKNALQFTVSREFDTHVEAQKAALTAYSYMPEAGVLELQCGENGETSQSIWAGNAVLGAMSSSYRGERVTLTYSFTCGLLTATAPPDFVNGGEDTIMVKIVDIPSGAETVPVLFDPAFPGAGPVAVMLNVGVPDGQPKILAEVQQSTVGPSGFTALLSAEAPTGTYKLHVWAIQKPV